MALAVAESLGSGRSAHAVIPGSGIDLLVLRSDLGQQERAVLADGSCCPGRSGETAAERVGSRVESGSR